MHAISKLKGNKEKARACDEAHCGFARRGEHAEAPHLEAAEGFQPLENVNFEGMEADAELEELMRQSRQRLAVLDPQHAVPVGDKLLGAFTARNPDLDGLEGPVDVPQLCRVVVQVHCH